MSSQQIPSERDDEEKITGEPPRGDGRDEKPNGPSTDFAALIDAIKAEGSANRGEEQREDRAKRWREWITIVLLVCTLVALTWQVIEMIRVYGPIHEQAIASTEAANAARKQAENADKSLMLAQRAWVGPQNASIAAAPQIGKPVEFTLQYQNTGREPALNFLWFVEPFSGTLDDEARDTAPKITDYMNKCKGLAQWTGGSVVYPSTGLSSGYNLSVKSPDNFIDQSFIDKKKVIYLQGCFVYRTFDTPHHSYFCYFYKDGVTKPANLNICMSGHYAD